MFKELTNFSYDRTWLQAIGWYLAFTLSIMLAIMSVAFIIGVTGYSFGLTTEQEKLNRMGHAFGSIVAFIYCPLMTFLVLRAKKRKGFHLIAFPLLSMTLSLLGVFVGLLPAAFLTTRKSLST